VKRSYKPSVVDRAPEKYIAVAEVARSVGVLPEATVAWFRRHRHKVFKKGRYNYVSLATAELYLNARGLERVAQRPRGWRTVKAVLDCGVGRETVMKAVKAGRIRAVMYRKAIYLQPDDAESFTLEYRSARPLPGWVLAPELRNELGRSKEALNQWIRREKVEVRRFLHPTRNRLTPYIREADADRYRQIVRTGSEKHKGRLYSGGVHSRDLVLQAIAGAGAAGVTASEIAKLTGLGRDTCRNTVRELAESGLLNRNGKGSWKEHYRFTIAQLQAAA
jgi:hypothetical protein